MPTYEYNCLKCDKEYSTIKKMSEYDGKDECPQCGNVGQRIFSSQVYFAGTKVEDAEYSPAFGRVIRNKRERQELAKENGMIELGNEPVSNLHKDMERTRMDRINKRYDDI